MYVKRDPFARTELKRQCIIPTPQFTDLHRCKWCGQQPYRLYQYGTESDGGTFYGWAEGMFCNLECFEAYHGH